MKDKVKLVALNCEGSNEAISEALKANFAAKIILVNHEKRLDVDTTCSNLAIKYQMLYFSVYQLIREHIQNHTSWGKKLVESKKPRSLNAATKVVDDVFEEGEFSAAHYDLELVITMVCAAIADKRTT